MTAFIQKFFWFVKGHKGRSGGVLGEGGTVWKMAAARLHNEVCLDYKERYERTTHCTFTYHDSLMGSAASTRGVERWQQTHRVGCGATNGRHGGAERIVWETLLEMERFNYRAGEEDTGAITVEHDSAEAFERVGLPVVWAWAAHTFHGSFCVCSVGISIIRGEFNLKVVWRSRSETITAILPGSKWSSLLLRVVLQYALSEVTKIYPPLKLRVFVDDITGGCLLFTHLSR